MLLFIPIHSNDPDGCLTADELRRMFEAESGDYGYPDYDDDRPFVESDCYFD